MRPPAQPAWPGGTGLSVAAGGTEPFGERSEPVLLRLADFAASPPPPPTGRTGLRQTAPMVVLSILALVMEGLIVGALGRLAIPGPNPMSIGQTILVGVGGALLGGLVGHLFLGGAFVFLLGVLGAALIVYLIERGRTPAR